MSSSIDFEDTYDGLGDGLEEAGDDLNHDTFGVGSGGTQKPIGKDFDFFGRTAQVSDAIEEEQLRYTRGSESGVSLGRAQVKPSRTGYEKYQNLEHVSDLQVDQSLWGEPEPQQQQKFHQAVPERKMMSLDEVENQMRSQKKPLTPSVHQQPIPNVSLRSQSGNGNPLQDLQRSSAQVSPPVPQQSIKSSQISAELPATIPKGPQILQRHSLQSAPSPTIIPSGAVGPTQGRLPRGQRPGSGGLPGRPAKPNQQQSTQLSASERELILKEEAKRAKRNHKIMLLSRNNGLMTPQDKNFITRIQLQQLMTASGSANEQDSDAVLSEDFYYQVHRQIRGGPRTNPQQPLSHFAQTYLFQTGGRHTNRRNNRGGDNHMQRMEQQVQRAVEAAKAKPKNKQLVIEGSLGKISFSNSKSPKPLLNIKRADHPDAASKTRNMHKNEISTNSRRTILKNIEAIYSALMKIEDEARKEPSLPRGEEPEPEVIEQHMAWRSGMQRLNERLWSAMKVWEPIDPGSNLPHPFIAILSYSKGKKVIPRVFRHMSSEQRITILTMIVIHLDILDVVRLGQLQPGETQLPLASREAIDIFSAAVTPSLFGYVSEAPLNNVMGLLGLIIDRVNVQAIAKTRVGLSILTMLTSRATLIREAGATNEEQWQNWTHLYNRLFDVLEPVLGQTFPGSVNSGEDIYVWQFLAATGSGASPEQQQRLVIAVK